MANVTRVELKKIRTEGMKHLRAARKVARGLFRGTTKKKDMDKAVSAFHKSVAGWQSAKKKFDLGVLKAKAAKKAARSKK